MEQTIEEIYEKLNEQNKKILLMFGETMKIAESNVKQKNNT